MGVSGAGGLGGHQPIYDAHNVGKASELTPAQQAQLVKDLKTELANFREVAKAYIAESEPGPVSKEMADKMMDAGKHLEKFLEANGGGQLDDNEDLTGDGGAIVAAIKANGGDGAKAFNVLQSALRYCHSVTTAGENVGLMMAGIAGAAEKVDNLFHFATD